MRKLLILSILPLLSAAGCADDGLLHRVEVWKQQNWFAPAEPVVVAPMAPCADVNCGPAVSGPEISAPMTTTVNSPEVIDGVLEQQ